MKQSKISKSIILKSFTAVVILMTCTIVLVGCNVKTNKNVDYENDKYGFTLELSKSFSENIEIIEEENVVYLANKEIRETNPENIFGVVGRIEIYEKEKFTKDDMKQKSDAYNLKILGESEDFYFGSAYPTDVQFNATAPQKLKDKYNAMVKEFDEIIKTFKIIE